MMSFSSRISLLIVYLDDLSIGDRGVLTSPTTTVWEFKCAFQQDLPGTEGGKKERVGGGQGREMTKRMYAHVNK
jgi:hypothetical protein